MASAPLVLSLYTIILCSCLQVINGIMKRPDWETTIRIPVGMIPIGSGNGLAASTFYEAE